ncbi:outer membrane protein [Candidatus Bartonella washoeensis]|uniref:Porin n=1 Tax=Cardidatus Bartonella washoeensis 085-0475 TaxID=1094564 RepID=J1JPX0_9HYPH|nr:outer membrane protein [Bartonella washoeensis]EJF86395.1 hypothetical protein MCW_00291 [Bartonella washoeensis 085-0475]
MNTKYLVTVSAFAFFSASIVQAADVIVPQQPTQVVSSVVAPTFSWQGFYFGGQIGRFSSKISATTRDVDVPLFPDEDSKNKKWVPVEKKYLPELSGFLGGFYAGANVDFGDNFILGVDTDLFLSERKKTKAVVITGEGEDVIPDAKRKNSADSSDGEKEELQGLAVQVLQNSMGAKLGRLSQSVVKNQREAAEQNALKFCHTLKQKWSGATRVRIGFSADRFMPYIAGGVAYGQLQDILSVSVTGEDSFEAKLDKTKTMIGYTLGGGVDFAMSNNVILRAEYRYSDFGKKKFGDEIELDYKTNDFRFGVAYKF